MQKRRVSLILLVLLGLVALAVAFPVISMGAAGAVAGY